MALEFRRIEGEALRRAIPDLAALRIGIFAEYPYLYDGSFEYEARYLRKSTALAEGSIAVTLCIMRPR